jgi:glycosyltransferase involved in cell wall biosynthesis
MRILAAHNHYQRPGGEDVVFQLETALLEAHGEEVVRYTADNRSVDSSSRIGLAVKTVWNQTAWREVRTLIRRTRPDVLHVHNTLPLISPSIYSAAHAEGVPVVQTLHNFRLLCPGSLFLRDGHTCEDCLDTRTCWPGVVHGCYRGSRAATAVVAAMLGTHALAGTWHHGVDRYIALSEFVKRKFVAAGWPEEKFAVKPNFIDRDPGLGTVRDGSALFVGRLSPEKGLQTLLAAIRRLPDPPLLKIVGDGPLMPADPNADPGVRWIGHQTRDRVVELMQAASLLVVPSESYETSPLAIIEAFATGLPVIATRLGTMGEMVTEGVTGLLYTLRDASDLAGTIGWAQSHPADMQEMARRARMEFERKYTPERHYERLIEIYCEAINERMHHRVQLAGCRSGGRDLPGADPTHKRAGATPG